MKNYIKLFLLVGVMIASTSCKKEAENWSTEAVDFAGKFITQCYNEEGLLLQHYKTAKTAIYIANTSENKREKIFIKADYLGIQSKFDISGNPDGFKSVAESFAKAYNNLLAIKVPNVPPTSESDVQVEQRPNVRLSIISCSIKKGAFTTVSGNVTDKFDLKLRSYAGNLTFKSKVKPKEKWVKPGVPEYEWSLEGIEENTNEKLNETYILEGFRHTGFHEDDLR